MSAGSKLAVMGVVAAAVGFGLRQGVIAMRGETVIAQATLDEQGNELETTRQAESQARARAEAVQNELERAKAELADRETALADAKQHAAKLTSDLEATRQQAAEEASRAAAQQSEVAKLSDKLKQAESASRKVADEASKADAKLREAQTQAAKAESSAADLTRELARARAEADAARREGEARLASADKSLPADGGGTKFLEQTPKNGVAYYARRRGPALVDRRFELCEPDGAASKDPAVVPVAGQYARATVFVNVQAQPPAYDPSAKQWTAPEFVGAFAPGRVVRIEETLSEFPGGEIWVRYTVAD
jgi:hypothetical protein